MTDIFRRVLGPTKPTTDAGLPSDGARAALGRLAGDPGLERG